jgi:hypothetical protein
MQSYWAFPPGKDLTTFQRDELYCNTSYFGLVSTCLKNRGYEEISHEEFIQRQKRAQQELEAGLKPIDVAAYEVSSHEIFIGKSESFVETKGDGSSNVGAALRIEGVTSNVYCSGQAELVKATAIGRGSIGSATLLCKDGRVIKAVFTYESPRSGFGSGTDGSGSEYRFVFGDLDLNPEELRKSFEQPRTNKLPS